jgi:hypothetical protein
MVLLLALTAHMVRAVQDLLDVFIQHVVIQHVLHFMAQMAEHAEHLVWGINVSLRLDIMVL